MLVHIYTVLLISNFNISYKFFHIWAAWNNSTDVLSAELRVLMEMWEPAFSLQTSLRVNQLMVLAHQTRAYPTRGLSLPRLFLLGPVLSSHLKTDILHMQHALHSTAFYTVVPPFQSSKRFSRSIFKSKVLLYLSGKQFALRIFSLTSLTTSSTYSNVLKYKLNKIIF